MAEHTTVDFWFDPVCPWAWLTSRWLLEAATVRHLDPRWHVMSLAVLNAGKEGMDQDKLASYWGPVRVLAAARAKAGDDSVLALYTAMGTRIHLEQAGLGRDMIEAALAAADLPPELADAMDSADLDDEVRASHSAAMALVGDDVGTPVISFDGYSIFGPVVSPTPRGEAAGRLWDGVATVVSTPGFFELKRGRQQAPVLI
ncbi:MAG: disulfide bond formation protein DsbA [Mycobacteriales bacterium]